MQLFYKTLQEKQQIDGRDQNDHKRRKSYRQMFPKSAKPTTNAGELHGKCGQLRQNRQQTPEKNTTNVVSFCKTDNKRRKSCARLER